MANNVMQQLRSNTTAAPASLANGQLAYSGVSNLFFIGSPIGSETPVIAIGGYLNFGIGGANVVMSTNSTGGYNNGYFGNLNFGNSTQNVTGNSLQLTLGGVIINANGGNGISGQVLTSGGGTTNNYWSTVASGSTNANGANQAVQFNNSSIFGGSSGFTFNYLTNTGFIANTLNIGNSTVNTSTFLTYDGNGNTSINSTSISIGNSTIFSIVNSTVFTQTSNNSTNLGGVAAAAYVQNNMNGNLTGNITFTGTNTVISSNVTHAANSYFNGANTYIDGTDFRSTSNNTLAGTNTVISSNVTHAANSYFNGANTYIDGTDFRSTSNNTLAGTNTVISSNLTFSGGFLYGGAANATFNNLVVNNNLTVSGTLTTINTSELLVNTNFIELAENNKITDIVDSGWFSPAGNSSLTWYSLFGRIAAKSTNNNPYFFLGVSNTNPNTASTFDISNANSAMGTLQSYLVSNAFVSNSSVVNITATGSISSAIIANTLTLSTALAAIYGGTGQTSYTTGDVLYASTGTALSKLSVPGSAANGQVLQITNNLPAYGVLDAGSF